MSIPYTYYLINAITKEKYYGVRYGKDCNPSDLWTTYFSSSKQVKRLIKLYGANSFTYEVRKIFSTAEEARNWEERVLRKLNVMKNASWLNKSICGKFLKEGPQSAEHKEKRLAQIRGKNHPFYGKKPPFYGKKHDESSLEKMRKQKSDTTNMIFNINNSSKVACPHCSKTGQLTNMKRWHFERCKDNPNRLTDMDPKTMTCSKCGHAATATPNFFKYHEDHCKLIPQAQEIDSK